MIRGIGMGHIAEARSDLGMHSWVLLCIKGRCYRGQRGGKGCGEFETGTRLLLGGSFVVCGCSFCSSCWTICPGLE